MRCPASRLPLPFPGDGEARGVDGVAGCGESVGGSVTRVAGNVGGCGSATGRSGGGTGGRVVNSTGGGVGGECGCARVGQCNLAVGPGTRGCESSARSGVVRVLPLEGREHILSTVSGPEHERALFAPVEPRSAWPSQGPSVYPHQMPLAKFGPAFTGSPSYPDGRLEAVRLAERLAFWLRWGPGKPAAHRHPGTYPSRSRQHRGLPGTSWRVGRPGGRLVDDPVGSPQVEPVML